MWRVISMARSGSGRRRKDAGGNAKRAFTLLEVAVLLVVMSILAAVVVPVQMSQTRSQKVDALVRQIAMIFDAARRVWFYNSQMASRIDFDLGAGPWTAATNLGDMNAINDPGMLGTYTTQDNLVNVTANMFPVGKLMTTIRHDLGSWPGQMWRDEKVHTNKLGISSVVPTAPEYKCRSMMDHDRARQEISAVGNLASSPFAVWMDDIVFRNPWGMILTLGLDSPGNGDPLRGPSPYEYNCWFTITTEVPTEVARMVKGMLPNAACNFAVGDTYCNNSMGAPPFGFTRCCTTISRPGWEPRTRWWWGALATTEDAPFCTPWRTYVGNDPPPALVDPLCDIVP